MKLQAHTRLNNVLLGVIGSKPSPAGQMADVLSSLSLRLKSTSLMLLGLFLLAYAMSQELLYTVQVVAVSSELTALELQQSLREQGYPAYLVSVPTSQGVIYRLRVGAFANRAAAAIFAETMQGVLDSNPSPALAEGIPPDLVPLLPELISIHGAQERVQILEWLDAYAIRHQPLDNSRQARYLTQDYSFDAWRARPNPDGSITRVYSYSLWPEAWQINSAQELESYRQAALERLAERLSLLPEQVRAFEFKTPEDVPFVVLVEVVDPRLSNPVLLRALGQPRQGLAADGPELQVFSGQPELVIRHPEALLELNTLNQSAVQVLSTDHWQAQADGAFVSVSVATRREWRAAVGQPLWAHGEFLISRAGQDLLIYRLVEP